MIQLTTDFKKLVAAAILQNRSNYGGTDAAFSKHLKINNSIYSRLKGGETEGILKDTQWLEFGRLYNVTTSERTWNMARTEVYNKIESEVVFCQKNAKAMVMVDETELGKSFSGKYLSRTLKNCFYIDASQAKTKQIFIRLIAQTIGVDDKGKYTEVKANIKYYLKMLPQPMVIIDEAGDLDYTAFLELKELWNATEGACGWYMMGADGLRTKIERGIRGKKVGYKEMFSRFSGKYTVVTPIDRKEKYLFYKKLITDVLTVNMKDKKQLNEIVQRCIITDETGYIGGLRRAESLLILYSQQ